MIATDDLEDQRCARISSQLLAGPPAGSPEEVVGHLLAVQAQDERGFRLAVRSRTSGLLASDVDDALSVRRSLLVTWLNRGTLHLVRPEDYWWMHPLTTPRLAAANARRLRQEGVNAAQAEHGVDAIVDAVSSEGPQTRQALRRRLDEAGVRTAGQALVHLLVASSLRGHIVRGPIIDGQHAYVAVRDWLGQPPAPLDPGEALARLARRYLASHGPASARDLAKWSGITLSDARRGLAAIADETAELGTGTVLTAALVGGLPRAPARLLGPFDPVLHGWASRAPFVGDHAGVVTTNGIFRPVALAGGRVVATWRLPGGVVTICPLERIPPGELDALAEDATDVLRFLGLEHRPVVIG